MYVCQVAAAVACLQETSKAVYAANHNHAAREERKYEIPPMWVTVKKYSFAGVLGWKQS